MLNVSDSVRVRTVTFIWLPPEPLLPCAYIMYDAAKAPNVNLAAVLNSIENLGGLVALRANYIRKLRPAIYANTQIFCVPEVTDLSNAILGEDDVACFQVSVHDTLDMGCLQA